MACEGVSALVQNFGNCSLNILQERTALNYVFLGGTALDLRCKTRIISGQVSRLEDVPWTSVDGSLTGQAAGGSTLVYLKPRCLFRDPFRAVPGMEAFLVLCDTHMPPSMDLGSAAQAGGSSGGGGSSDWEPHPSNNRAFCELVMQQAAGFDPWFSCEQQYTLLDAKTLLPLGQQEQPTYSQSLPPQQQPAQQQAQQLAASTGGGDGYCCLASGSPAQAQARMFAEAHMRACLQAGIKVTGMHSLAAPGRWCYTLGTLAGLHFADQLWASRFVLLKLAEQQGLVVSLEARSPPGAPITDAGPAALVRFSTNETREGGGCGWQAIQQHVRRLEATHAQHMLVYGTGNNQRMLFPDTAAALGRFSAGVESTSASVRVPHSVVINRQGYYEDRRPAANMDPYLCSLMLVCTTCAVPLPTRAGATPAPNSVPQPSPVPAAASSSCSGAKQVPQRRHQQQQQQQEVQQAHQQQQVAQQAQQQQQHPWGAAGGGASGGLSSSSLSGGASASNGAILGRLDMRLQQGARPGLMPDTPDQQTSLLEGAGDGSGRGSGEAQMRRLR